MKRRKCIICKKRYTRNTRTGVLSVGSRFCSNTCKYRYFHKNSVKSERKNIICRARGCYNEFSVTINSRTKYCSKECLEKSKQVALRCENCKRWYIFVLGKKMNLSCQKFHTCSRKCYGDLTGMYSGKQFQCKYID